MESFSMRVFTEPREPLFRVIGHAGRGSRRSLGELAQAVVEVPLALALVFLGRLELSLKCAHLVGKGAVFAVLFLQLALQAVHLGVEGVDFGRVVAAPGATRGKKRAVQKIAGRRGLPNP